MENQEVWKPVVGYEGLYEVSSNGNIRSLDMVVYFRNGGKQLRKGRVLIKNNTNSGYQGVCLCKNKIKKTHLVHRIVAEAFIKNAENLPQVNHINEVKTDNRAENLEWVTAKYNLEYSNVNGKSVESCSKPVLQYTKYGQFVAEYKSTMDAERKMGINHRNISFCCRGKRKSAGNYLWRYKDEEKRE